MFKKKIEKGYIFPLKNGKINYHIKEKVKVMIYTNGDIDFQAGEYRLLKQQHKKLKINLSFEDYLYTIKAKKLLGEQS